MINCQICESFKGEYVGVYIDEIRTHIACVSCACTFAENVKQRNGWYPDLKVGGHFLLKSKVHFFVEQNKNKV